MANGATADFSFFLSSDLDLPVRSSRDENCSAHMSYRAGPPLRCMQLLPSVFAWKTLVWLSICMCLRPGEGQNRQPDRRCYICHLRQLQHAGQHSHWPKRTTQHSAICGGSAVCIRRDLGSPEPHTLGRCGEQRLQLVSLALVPDQGAACPPPCAVSYSTKCMGTPKVRGRARTPAMIGS